MAKKKTDKKKMAKKTPAPKAGKASPQAKKKAPAKTSPKASFKASSKTSKVSTKAPSKTSTVKATPKAAKKKPATAPKASSKVSKPVKKAPTGSKNKAPSKKSPSSKKSTSQTASPAQGSQNHASPRFPIIGKKNPFQEFENQNSGKPKKYTKSFLNKQLDKLLELREHIWNQMHGVAQDSLRAKSDAAGSAFGMHQADAGSDAYEKDFALSLLSQEQDAIYEIDQAIKRIESGTYGICEMSGEVIPETRLEAIPYARFTAYCQHQMEKENKNRGRWSSSPQFMGVSDTFFEDPEPSDDDSNMKE